MIFQTGAVLKIRDILYLNFSNDTTEKGRIFMLRETYFGKVIPWERKNRKCAEQSEIVKKIEDEERYFVQKLSSL